MGDISRLDSPPQAASVEPSFDVEDALKKLSGKEKIDLLAGRFGFSETRAG